MMLYAYIIILVPSLLVFLAMTFLSSDHGGGDGGADVVGGLHGDAGSGDMTDGGADGGADGGVDGGADGGDHATTLFSYLTFRNCINYLIGFGAAGALAQSAGVDPVLAAGCALSGGAVSAFIMYKLMAGLYALSDEQEADAGEILGRQGRVYIEVGARRSRRGKVLVTMKSAQREFPALTDHSQPLRPHATVRVVAQEDGALIVEPIVDDTGPGEPPPGRGSILREQ